MPVFRIITVGLGKALSKLFGLATTTFLGRQPSRDDEKVALMGLLSTSWLAVAVSIPFPALTELMIPFLPDDEALLRGTAIGLTLLIPPVVGWLVTRLHNREGEAGSVAREVLYGYGYAFIIGGLVVMLLVVVPLINASRLVRRFDVMHLAIMIMDDDYDAVLRQMCEAFERNGIEVRVEEPKRVIWMLFASFVWIEGHLFRRRMTKRMNVLRGEVPDAGCFEVTLHGTDISIVGQRRETSVVLALLAEELDLQNLYFSWDDRSQDLEDRIRDCQARLRNGREVEPDEIEAFSRDLRYLELEKEEWNSIRRQIYRIERDYYKRALEGAPEP